MKLAALLSAAALCGAIASVALPAAAQKAPAETAAAKRAAATLTNTQPFGVRMRGQGQLPAGRDLFDGGSFMPVRMSPQIFRLNAPATARIISVSGSTLTLRTASGMMVGVRVPASSVRALNIRTGMQARLIPLNQQRLTVQLLTKGRPR